MNSTANTLLLLTIRHSTFLFPSCTSLYYGILQDSKYVTRIYPCRLGFLTSLTLWVIKIKKPMILCARNTSKSREQNHTARTCENYVYHGSQNKIIKHGRSCFCFVFYVVRGLCCCCCCCCCCCVLGVLIGWAAGHFDRQLKHDVFAMSDNHTFLLF